LDVISFERRAGEFRCVIAIDFGFGEEFWATRREEPQILDEATGRIIADGYCIVGVSTWSEMEIRCKRLGVRLDRMIFVDEARR